MVSLAAGFNPFSGVKKPVTLWVDASLEGIGAVILQERRPVAYRSRALTDCQHRYAQIEKELLAIVYGCEKFHQYVYGREIQVESDHKPLESIFKKPRHQAPMRLQRMLLRLQRYTLNVTYKPGKGLHVTDALSRAYLQEQQEKLLEEELEVNWVTPQLPISEEKLNMFKKATADDPEMHMLRDITIKGWPKERKNVPKEKQKYWTFKEEISYASGLMFKNAKLIVPNQMRQEMLDRIHESHLGIVKCKERARDILYWPEYLLCVDYYSKYPEITKLSDMTSRGVITALKSTLARHGIPDIVVSDNGPQYSSAMFCSWLLGNHGGGCTRSVWRVRGGIVNKSGAKRGGLRARLQANPYRPALPSLFLTNARSLVNKMDKMNLRIVSEKIDSCVAIVTETWLDNNIPDAAVDLAGRSLLRADRTAASEKHRGGAVYISPRANAKLALEELYCMISLQMKNNPEAAVIVAGNFNHVELKAVFPKFHRHPSPLYIAATTLNL
ncbi:hypothetical protein L3Q82_006334 [Scortum barcoo]|uniref:Uncharacterized protein n=1 Tax=Scortum barcoo TaxID=214431 RepID=A0ACB8WZ00_9TELE|nr:hypothetical protein L3Q82_006334 [Scortum barcoo]